MSIEENPYRAPQADLQNVEQDPWHFDIPKIYFQRKLIVQKWKHVLCERWENEYEATFKNVRLSESDRDGSYHSLLLGDYWNGLHIRGANNFTFNEEGALTFRDYSDYPWPLYALTVQKNIIDAAREKYEKIIGHIFEKASD